MNNQFFVKCFLLICFIFNSVFLFAQKEEVYTYYIYMKGAEKGKEFSSKNNKALYNGKNAELKSFFNASNIMDFYQAFPEIPDPKLQNVYVMKTTNKQVCKAMLKKFPDYYSNADDISGGVTMLSYPNDYGATSPVTNLGINEDRKDLDYIDAPKAWDITTGSSNTVIGISDTGVNNMLPDLVKTNYISGYGPNYGNSAYHGSNVAALAAAQGNNGVGTVGVCYDCGILASPYLFGDTSDIVMSRIYKLASEGARVINMSWHNGVPFYPQNIKASGHGAKGVGYIEAEQNVINRCISDFGTIFVAAAGNISSFSTPTLHHPGDYANGPFGTLYVYPASYDNVISVSLVNNKFPSLDSNSYVGYNALYQRIDDSVSQQIDGTDLNNPVGISGDNGYGLVYMATLNNNVDILAPSYNQFEYWDYENNQDFFYNGTSTSYAAPLVTGTIGLMLTVNECLSGLEVEDILQLVSKDVEHMPINAPFFGMVGSGKLETGNAVHFVNEMQKTDGVAVIEDHIFYRFDFNLDKFMNNLLIDNVSFIDSVTVDFKAKNSIELIEGTLLEPNNNGYIVLDIDGNIQNNCTSSKSSKIKEKLLVVNDVELENETKVYPTYFDDNVTIINKNKELIKAVKIYNLLGTEVFVLDEVRSDSVVLSLGSLSSGFYVLNAYDDLGNIMITQKIVKK